MPNKDKTKRKQLEAKKVKLRGSASSLNKVLTKDHLERVLPSGELKRIKKVASVTSGLDLTSLRESSDRILTDDSEDEDYKTSEMADLQNIVTQMAQMSIELQRNQQLLQQQVLVNGADSQAPPQRQEGLLDVMKRASSGIIEFKKINLTNFLASVERHYDATVDVALKPHVLKIAQEKVIGSVQIETATYATFQAFKADMMANFKLTYYFNLKLS